MKTKIIVIDPCYVTKDKDWQLICNLADYDSKELEDPFDVIYFPRTVQGIYRDAEYKQQQLGRVLIHKIKGTENGDGAYDNIGVDSGTLSVCEVNEELYQKHKSVCREYSTVEEAIEQMEYICSQI